MAKRKFYVVWQGHAPGVYDSWEECRAQVEGYPNAKYKSYGSQTEAVEAFRGNPELDIIKSIASRPAVTVNMAAFPEIRTDAIAVDAACSGNPGVMEYRGVDVSTGAELFHFGPIPDATNNIGEFLALVHGLAMCKKQGWSFPIYSDSVTGMAWVRRGHAATKLERTARNGKLFEMIARAEAWLAANPSRNAVLKWETERWGEIPADFGRK